MRVTERLYLTADGRVVPDTDRTGRLLFAKKGAEIPDELARQYGLLPPLAEPEGVIVPPEIKRQPAKKSGVKK